MVATGWHRGLSFHYDWQPGAGRPLLGPENVHRALVVAADGAVAPCVFATLPIIGATYWSRGVEHPFGRLSFGNVQEDSLGGHLAPAGVHKFSPLFFHRRPV